MPKIMRKLGLYTLFHNTPDLCGHFNFHLRLVACRRSRGGGVVYAYEKSGSKIEP